jgi:putative ABC transport system permease protein
MTAPVGTNRKMFWRIIRRLLESNPGRLFVILLALGTGAAVTSALLNLQVDAKRRLTTEFRVLGANVIIAPRTSTSPEPATLNQSVLERIPLRNESSPVLRAGLLYAVIDVAVGFHNGPEARSKWVPVVLAGYSSDVYRQLLPSQAMERSQPTGGNMPLCYAGSRVAKQLHLHSRDLLFIKTNTQSDDPDPATQAECFVQGIDNYGGPEDNQIFINLETIQILEGLRGRISLIQLSVPGTPEEIQSYITDLQKRIPDSEVRPIRQFTEAEAKIYDRISGLLTATVALVLLLTGLCVMAAMTNVAMERRNDVGLMKAIGGASRRVLRLFLAEAALLGLTGGLLGAAAGIALSIGLGKAVFGVAARPRLIVYPVAVALTIIVAIAGAFPLRRLTSIRPASVFRGEA